MSYDGRVLWIQVQKLREENEALRKENKSLEEANNALKTELAEVLEELDYQNDRGLIHSDD